MKWTHKELQRNSGFRSGRGGSRNKKLYAHCYGDNDLFNNTIVNSFAYTYDGTWKDKLTIYAGKAITCDAIGNPKTYDGWTYTW